MNQDQVWVDLNGERFIVQFSAAGEPLNIKQRKKWAAGMPWECWHNAPYWHHSHKLTPKPAAIIAAAREKQHVSAA
jgi:hypothetical protein